MSDRASGVLRRKEGSQAYGEGVPVAIREPLSNTKDEAERARLGVVVVAASIASMYGGG